MAKLEAIGDQSRSPSEPHRSTLIIPPLDTGVSGPLLNRSCSFVAQVVEERGPTEGNADSKTRPDTVPK
jgi:hypothetical protein